MSDPEIQALHDRVNKKSKPIVQAISSLKAQVDIYLSQIESRPTDNNKDKDAVYVKDLVEEVESLLKDIKQKDTNIIKIFKDKEIDSLIPEFHNEELCRQIQYQWSIK